MFENGRKWCGDLATMNSNPFALFLSLLLVLGILNTGGVEQKGARSEDVVVTDGIELQKVFERTRSDPTKATKLRDDEETDLVTARREHFNSDTQGKTRENSYVDVTSLEDSDGRQASENEDTRRGSNDGERTPHHMRTNLEERLNIDSLSKDQRHATRDSLAKANQNKLARPAEQSNLEASISVEKPSIPDSNISATPPPNILKVKNTPARAELDDIYFLFIVIGCSVAGIAGLALAGYCWYKLHTTAKAVSEAEYSAYGAAKPGPQVAQGDHKLDYSAEIYHYQQTKSQLSAMEKASGKKGSIKGETLNDEEENSDEGDEEDYTVYECHGLAPTGDMTVVNPLFSDQEVVGSDQDGNGNKSGASGEGSPVMPRHPHKE